MALCCYQQGPSMSRKKMHYKDQRGSGVKASELKWWVECWPRTRETLFSLVLVRWAIWTHPRVVPVHSLEAHPNGYIRQGAWGCSVASSKQGKTGLKMYLLFGGLFPVEWSMPPVIWTAGGAAREHSQPWKQLATIWMAALGSGLIGGPNVCTLPIAPSGSTPFLATVRSFHWQPSDHGYWVTEN